MEGVMRFIVVDLEGASRLSFERLSDARDWARKQGEHDPDLLAEVLIERYDAAGHKVGHSQWADDFLRDLSESMVPARGLEQGGIGALRLRGDQAQPVYEIAFSPDSRLGLWSGMAASSLAAFSHRHEGAIGTLVPPQVGTAAS
jgi:hypothetical protein